MGFSYRPLWVLIAKHGQSKTEFRQAVDIGTNQLAKMGKNEYVAMEILDRICNHYGCELHEVVEHVKEQEE